MGKRIFRGAAVGIVLGCVFGVVLSYIVGFGQVFKKNKTAEFPEGLYAAHDEYFEAGDASREGEQAYRSVFSEFPVDVDAALGSLNIENTLLENEKTTEGVIGTDEFAKGVEVDFAPAQCGSVEDVILRFHVRANSDSTEDIELKYLVRDEVLERIGENLPKDYSRDDVLSYISENVDELKELAEEVISKSGHSYSVNAYITNDFFPIRQYGEMVLPAGNYQAFRIDIGEAEGENFWCMLYPMMCYTIDSGAIASRSDGERLREVLSVDEYKELFVEGDTGNAEVKVRFKLLEVLGFYD